MKSDTALADKAESNLNERKVKQRKSTRLGHQLTSKLSEFKVKVEPALELLGWKLSPVVFRSVS